MENYTKNGLLFIFLGLIVGGISVKPKDMCHPFCYRLMSENKNPETKGDTNVCMAWRNI